MKSRWLPWLVVALLVIVTVALRLWLIDLPEPGGDARANWIAAHRLLYGEHETLRLSFSRLGIQIPTAAIIFAFGSHPLVYHVTPILMSVVAVLAVFALVRRYAGDGLAVIAALGVIVFPLLQREGTQLLPGTFSCAYLVLAMLALARVLESPSSRWRLAVLGLVLFASYLVKFSDLFVLPGVVIALVVAKVPWRNIALFLLGLVLLYGLEHLFFATHGWPYGQLQMLLGDPTLEIASPERRTQWEVHGLGDFFRRYSADQLGRELILLYLAFVASAATLLAIGRRDHKLLVGVVVSHLVINTFAIQGIDPIILLTRPVRRYHALYVGAMLVIVCLALHELRHRALGALERARDLSRRPAIERGVRAVAIGLGLVVVLRVGATVPGGIVRAVDAVRAGSHPIQLTFHYNDLISRAFQTHQPILGWPEQPKQLQIANTFYRPRSDADWGDAPLDYIRRIHLPDRTYSVISSLSREETRAALAALGPDAEVIWVGPDPPFEPRRIRWRDVPHVR